MPNGMTIRAKYLMCYTSGITNELTTLSQRLCEPRNYNRTSSTPNIFCDSSTDKCTADHRDAIHFLGFSSSVTPTQSDAAAGTGILCLWVKDMQHVRLKCQSTVKVKNASPSTCCEAQLHL
jgi:hypothetical protein